MATGKLQSGAVRSNEILQGVIHQTICGNTVVINISGSIGTVASGSDKLLGTLTEKKPSANIVGVATSSGNTPVYAPVIVYTDGRIILQNRSGTSIAYLYMNLSYLTNN